MPEHLILSVFPNILLGWGLVPAAGILVGGAFWLGKRSNRVTTSLVDFVEPETEVRDLEPAEILVLEEATDDRVHLESNSKSESVRIDSLSETLRER